MRDLQDYNHVASHMLTLEQCRRIDPSMECLSDQEVSYVRDKLYELSQLAFDDWQLNKKVSKNPTRD